MLRIVLALLSSLQIGVRLKDSFERSLRQALVIAIAAVVLIAAAAFGLLAAYHALIATFQFSQAEAACIIAASLLLLGLLILAVAVLVGRKRKPKPAPSIFAATSEGVGAIDQSLGKAMQQIGPIGLLAIAFIAGVLASRR